MKPTKHILLLAALLLGSLAASAEDFEVDGIYYNITSETDLTVEVTYRGTNSNSYPDEYTGEVAIPGTATYNGNTYSVTSVGSSAFYGCKNLTAVTIPEGVTSIGGSAFYGCSGLATITVSETVSTIGSNAFSNCSVLTHIAIPSSVTSVGNFCFSGCIRLDSVVFEDGDETLLLGNCKYSDGVGGGLFEGLRINEVYVGRNLKFSDHNDSYNRPYYTALFACWNANSYPIVSTVTIGPRVTELPDYMFQDCKDLTVIICMAEEVPVCYSSSFKTIRKEKGLDLDRCMLFVPAESVEAYKAVAYWSEFANIRPISTNDVDSGTCGENLTWTLYADGELIIEGTGKMGSYTSSTMPWYCYRAMIKSVTVKEGVTSVGQSAFSGCIRLTSATLHESVTSIGNNAFSGCTDLTSVTLPEGVTSIGGYAFSACSSLASITIPESVASIGENAFSNGYLTAVHISNLESWCMITFGNYASNPLANAHDLYLNGELVTELVVPEGVASIGRMAFYKCSSLTSITIPESVTSIGNNAFYNCSGVTAITCKAVTPPAIGNSYTFDGVDKSILIYVPAESVEAYKAAEYWNEFTNIQSLGNEYTLTVSAAGYATLYLDYAVVIPEEVEVYIASKVEGDRLKMTEVEGVLPANTGVIVRAKAGTYTFVESEETPADVEGNLLTGTTTDTYITAASGYRYYVLAQKDGAVGMYRPKLTDGQFLNNANKAYLALDLGNLGIFDDEVDTGEEGGQLSNRLRFDFGGTTSIQNSQLTIQNSQFIYDLHGRRVENPTKGIYIVNGRKVVVK